MLLNNLLLDDWQGYLRRISEKRVTMFRS